MHPILIRRPDNLIEEEAFAAAARGSQIAAVSRAHPAAQLDKQLYGGRDSSQLPARTMPQSGHGVWPTVSAIGAAAPPDGTPRLDADGDLSVALSAASLLIARLRGSLVDGIPAALTAQHPLLTAPPQGADLLPDVLRRSIANSGLFYEAHLAEWVAGRRSRDSLLAEPQANWPSRIWTLLTGMQPPRGGENQGSILPADMVLHATDSAQSRLFTDPLQLLCAQLDALESRHFRWYGSLFPGQGLQWEVSEQPDPAAMPGDPPAWVTRISLQLPHLGPLAAQLALFRGTVTVQISVPPSSTDQLVDAAEELAAALRSAGIRPTGIRITDNDDA